MFYMFELKVTGFDDVARLVALGWPTHIISVVTRDMPAYGPHHLQVRVDDIIRPVPGLILPDPSDVARVLEFTADIGAGDRLLVHCVSGINRSTAVAIGVLIQHSIPYGAAYRQVAALRPNLEPNRLIISFVDTRFGLGGKLNRLIVDSVRLRRASADS